MIVSSSRILVTGSAGHLAGLYGSLAHEVLEPARGEPSLYEPIVAGGPDVVAQARYAVERELAVTMEDVLRRRTTVALRGLESRGAERLSPLLPGIVVAPAGASEA